MSSDLCGTAKLDGAVRVPAPRAIGTPCDLLESYYTGGAFRDTWTLIKADGSAFYSMQRRSMQVSTSKKVEISASGILGS